MTSDFFVEEADEWRDDIWKMIRIREEVQFIIITKRIVRFGSCLPDDWGDGYPNVTVGCTCENGEVAAERLPVFLSLPIADRFVTCEPLLSPVLLEPWLESGKIRSVIAVEKAATVHGSVTLTGCWIFGSNAAGPASPFILSRPGCISAKLAICTPFPALFSSRRQKRPALIWRPTRMRLVKMGSQWYTDS